MATINYTGPEEFEGLIHLFDLEFDLLSGVTGRAVAAGPSVEETVSMTEQILFDSGYSINNEDVYEVVYLDINLNYIDVTESYASVVVSATTVSG